MRSLFTDRNKLNIRRDVLKMIIVAVLLRVVTYLIYMVFMKCSPEHYMEYTWENILAAWRRWDANAYLDIAENGYGHYEEYGQHLYLVFLPLYPWIVKVFALIFRSYEFAGLFVSFVSILTGCVYLYLNVEEDYGKEAAMASVISLSVFPFAFFLNGIMTDSLFIALVCAFMFYLKKHNYPAVTLCGFLACLCRLQGWFLVFPIMVELWLEFLKKYEGRTEGKTGDNTGFKIEFFKDRIFWKGFWEDFILQGIKCMPMMFGVIIYLLINLKVEGNAFAFMKYQEEHWTHTMGPFWNCVKDMIGYIKDDSTGELSISIWWPQTILFAVQLVFVIYCIRMKMRPADVTFFIAFFIVTYSSTWLLSGSRYTLSVAPLFVGIGVFLSHHRIGKWIWYIISFALMITYTWRFYNFMSIM